MNPGHRQPLVAALAALAALGLACDPESEVRGASTSIAESLPSLSEDEVRRFQRGLGEFQEVDTAIEGLGPLFNGSSCAQCHSLGGLGGGGVARVTRATCREADGSHTSPPGGTLIHLFSTRPEIATAAPPSGCAVVLAQRRSTPLFGAGLLEAVSDDDLRALAASEPEAMRGRIALVKDPDSGRVRVGRFGWKAQHASLRAFAGDAYLNELGITNELFPEENAPLGDSSLLGAMDPVPDPEAAVGAIDALADFLRFLAPNASKRSPGATFDAIGCAVCHVRELPVSGRIGELAPVARAYSDLLLHDIGTSDGIAQGDAAPEEFRTAPLWGLRFVPAFLHDGRANSVEDAIAAHRGQAEDSRKSYFDLGPEERAELLRDLQSL